MGLLDFLFKLFYKHHISSWTKVDDPHAFVASDARLSLTVVFFFFLILPTYRLFWFLGIEFNINWDSMKPVLVFGPMLVAGLLGWQLTKLYYRRRGKKVVANLEIRKLKPKEYFQLIVFVILLLVTVVAWSLVIGFTF